MPEAEAQTTPTEADEARDTMFDELARLDHDLAALIGYTKTIMQMYADLAFTVESTARPAEAPHPEDPPSLDTPPPPTPPPAPAPQQAPPQPTANLIAAVPTPPTFRSNGQVGQGAFSSLAHLRQVAARNMATMASSSLCRPRPLPPPPPSFIAGTSSADSPMAAPPRQSLRYSPY